MSENTNNTVIDINQIMRMIPHRYPILLVDKVVDVVPGESATGIKNVTFNEPHFQGHFPNHPVMPGVLIVEAMAQTSAVLVAHTLGAEAEGKIVYFTSIEGAKFRKPVVPGDQLVIKVKKLQNKRTLWKFEATAEVDGKVATEAVISAMLMA
jgi:3-hydroxyacyl-[acyl-carrier-protein] dehydratase